jgi:hypothetical protein
MEEPYIEAGRSFYDIAAPSTSPFPREYYLGFLSQAWVQSALGVPVNFTESNNAVYDAFSRTGDSVRSGLLQDIASVLDLGVKVALVYGDRDFACNWIGGENVSLNIPWSGQSNFAGAGYTAVNVNSSYVGGQVRQYGNLSFTRLYESGHETPAYQAETSYEIFRRTMNGLDVATGQTQIGGQYSTSGPSDTWSIKNKIPPDVPGECYILSPSTCTSAQLDDISLGTAQVYNYIYGATAANFTSGNGTGSGSGNAGSGKKGAAGRTSTVSTVVLGVAVTMMVALVL